MTPNAVLASATPAPIASVPRTAASTRVPRARINSSTTPSLVPPGLHPSAGSSTPALPSPVVRPRIPAQGTRCGRSPGRHLSRECGWRDSNPRSRRRLDNTTPANDRKPARPSVARKRLAAASLPRLRGLLVYIGGPICLSLPPPDRRATTPDGLIVGYRCPSHASLLPAEPELPGGRLPPCYQSHRRTVVRGRAPAIRQRLRRGQTVMRPRRDPSRGAASP